MKKADMFDLAFEQAVLAAREGGVPVGAVLVCGGKVVGTGRNQRVQTGNPLAHAEMDCLTNAGRGISYTSCTLYTTLSPCMMCAGTILQFKIPRLVIGEARNFPGNIPLLKRRGVEIDLIDDEKCIRLMREFIKRNPHLWNEDIGE